MLIESYSIAAPDRYSAKASTRMINFIFVAPHAKSVQVIGDFNDWQPNVHPMRRQPDGGWLIRIAMHHGHHRYLFLVDGTPMLDPRAHGCTRNERDEKVSLIAVS